MEKLSVLIQCKYVIFTCFFLLKHALSSLWFKARKICLGLFKKYITWKGGRVLMKKLLKSEIGGGRRV